MNWIAGIIVAFLLIDLLVNTVADYLNLTMLRRKLPPEFEGVYDAERYRRSQAYLKVNTRFGWLTDGVNLTAFLIFWFAGGFAALDQWVRQPQFPTVLSGLVYIGGLSLLAVLLMLPFQVYHTFVIEERFGFNRTDWRTFAKDRLKGLALALVLGAPLLAGILAFFQYAGPGAWWWCWLAVVGYGLAVQFVAPTWIMPLFNTFTPLEEGELRSAIVAYAQKIEFPLKNIMVMDGSRRSSKSNAFFTGFGRFKRIVLFDTLIERHTVDELVGVLAHEMGHYKKKHIRVMFVLGALQTGVLFYLLSWFISYPPLFEAFYVSEVSVYAGLVFFAVLYSPLDAFLGLFVQRLSRQNEYAADRFSVTTTRNGAAMIDALKKLSVHNLSNLRPHWFYVFLNYSHPPVLDRINAIEGIAASGTGY